MKKFVKIVMVVLFASFLVGLSAKAVSPDENSDWQKPDFGEATLVTEFSKVKSLDKGIIKKETVSKYSYDYPKNLRGNYKYITVKTDFSYFDGKKFLANVVYESDFRFNSERKMSECLSSTCCYNCKDSVTIEPFTRRKNETLSKGSSVIKNKFKTGYTTCEDIEVNLKCDSEGNVIIEE
ncbi:MAG: hypothetical protein ACI4PR_03550 [Acutalibacteraceae bacterium]